MAVRHSAFATEFFLCLFSFYPPSDLQEKIFKIVVDEGNVLLELKEKEQNLEDVFKNLTRP
jgi:hypothetical protein